MSISWFSHSKDIPSARHLISNPSLSPRNCFPLALRSKAFREPKQVAKIPHLLLPIDITGREGKKKKNPPSTQALHGLGGSLKALSFAFSCFYIFGFCTFLSSHECQILRSVFLFQIWFFVFNVIDHWVRNYLLLSQIYFATRERELPNPIGICNSQFMNGFVLCDCGLS